MVITVSACTRDNMKPEDTHAMYRLRHMVFCERLHWDVHTADGMESDEYDDLFPVYMLARDISGKLFGCARLLPTTGDYMLKSVFPQLLQGNPIPNAEDTWELSRFAFEQPKGGEHRFSLASSHMVVEALEFALDNNITCYVGVTTVAFEKLLRKIGLHVKRFGPPMMVGHERSVAFSIDVTTAQLAAARSSLLLAAQHVAPPARASQPARVVQ